MYKILIAENIPSLNKGELAILRGIIESFKEIGVVQTSILSVIPDFDKKRYGSDINVIDVRGSLFIPSDPLSRSIWQGLIFSSLAAIQHVLFLLFYKIIGKHALMIFKGDLWKEYIESDAIIIGHNGTFGLGGNLLPFLPFFSYFSYLYLPFFSRILNKPTVIYGGSISPFKKNHKFLWRWISYVLENISLITLREESAYKNLESLGVRTDNAIVTADLAFLFQSYPEDCIKWIIEKEGLDRLNRPLFAFTVTQEIASKAMGGYDAHVAMVAQLIDEIIEEKNASVVFLPHCIGFGDIKDDRIIAKDILDACKNKDHVKSITDEYSAEDLKSILGYVDFLIGERLHSVINALCMHTPSLIISYSGDVRLDIIRMIGQESLICYVDNLTLQDLMNKIEHLMKNNDKISKELRDQIPKVKELSMGNARRLKLILR